MSSPRIQLPKVSSSRTMVSSLLLNRKQKINNSIVCFSSSNVDFGALRFSSAQLSSQLAVPFFFYVFQLFKPVKHSHPLVCPISLSLTLAPSVLKAQAGPSTMQPAVHLLIHSGIASVSPHPPTHPLLHYIT